MKNYSIHIAWSERDHGFIATVPEFRHLSAVGDTYAEALQEIQTALDGFIKTYQADGVALPQARGVSEFSGQIRLRLPKGLHASLAVEAERQGVSLNTFMVSLLSLNHGLQNSVHHPGPPVYISDSTPPESRESNH